MEKRFLVVTLVWDDDGPAAEVQSSSTFEALNFRDGEYMLVVLHSADVGRQLFAFRDTMLDEELCVEALEAFMERETE